MNKEVRPLVPWPLPRGNPDLSVHVCMLQDAPALCTLILAHVLSSALSSR